MHFWGHQSKFNSATLAIFRRGSIYNGEKKEQKWTMNRSPVQAASLPWCLVKERIEWRMSKKQREASKRNKMSPRRLINTDKQDQPRMKRK